MKLLLDTNLYSDFRRNDAAVKKILAAASTIYLPFAVVAELRAGFLRGQQLAQNERLLEEFLRPAYTAVLYADEATTRVCVG